MNGLKRYRSLLVAVVLSALSVLARAQVQYTGIYTFNGNVEGCCANSPALLAQGTDGNLYGTLPSGANRNAGSSLQYRMGGAPILTNFGNGSGLSGSNSGYTLGIDGRLYGAVNFGSGTGYGAVIVSSGGLPSMIYQFQGGSDGYFPNAPPVQGTDLNLYGVTKDYGNAGLVYQIVTATRSRGWTVQLPSGSTAPLIPGSDGNFYGTYSNGSFSRNSAGAIVPSGGGFGGIFEISPSGAIIWYYNLDPFSANNGNKGDGSVPVGPVMQGADGNLYGTASGNGANCSACGVVFKIGPNGTSYTVIHNFQSADGTTPQSGLVQGSDGYIYGLTTQNGSLSSTQQSNGYLASGTLFKLSPSGANFTVLFTFYRHSGTDGRGSGSDPQATMTLHTNGVLYGLTHAGGFNQSGAASGPGAFDDAGEFFSFKVGLSKFISIVGRRTANPGQRVMILGQGFLNATGVTFGGIAVSTTGPNVRILNDNSMSVVIPLGARSGPVTVFEANASYSTLYNFTIPCTNCR